MGKKVCVISSDLKTKMESDEAFKRWVDPERIEYVNQGKAYSMDLELTQKCAGSCAYCYTGSTIDTDTHIPTKRLLELIDEAKEVDIKQINWLGGDPILHPDWYEVVSYAAEKGLTGFMCTSSMISKKVAKQLCELRPNLRCTLVDISTINPEAYRILHSNPSTLEIKIQGYRNLLEAGYPAAEVTPIMALTKPALDTLEETVDWFMNEMGATSVCLVQYKPDEFGKQYLHLEPSKSDVKEALEFRARRFGDHWLRVGTMDTSFYVCKSTFGVKYDGRVTPCVNVPVAMGSIYEESLKEIFDKHISEILYEEGVEGFCGNGECPNADICFGCRGTAYFTSGGNYLASDGKCYLNPNAEELYFLSKS